MGTPKQIAANRLNAAKSTGPKGTEGKAVSAQNSTRHGLRSSNTLLPWEDSSAFEVMRSDVMRDLAPVGTLEELLVGRITSLTWRLQRAGHIETAIFAFQKYSEDLKKAKENTNSLTRTLELVRATSSASDTKEVIITEREVEAWTDVIEKSSLLNSDFAKTGRDFIASADALTSLHRYEVAIERSLYKALHELQRLQAVRQGNSVPAPVAIDLHGDSGT